MWHKRRRPWRHRLVSRGRERILRECLAAALILECSYGMWALAPAVAGARPVIRVDDSIEAEWFLPAKEQEAGSDEVYGVRFDWRAGELRFYHRSGQISGH